jgi:hypothetical protein
MAGRGVCGTVGKWLSLLYLLVELRAEGRELSVLSDYEKE